jgi:hypothetical protein
MEVLDPSDVRAEAEGTNVDGVLSFPRAEPMKMLRIFRARFTTIKDAEDELRRVKTIQSYLMPNNVALSQEFLVDYVRHGHRDSLLCGLQEFVKGEILEPWAHLDEDYLASLLPEMGVRLNGEPFTDVADWIEGVQEKAERFVNRLKKMIMETNYVPDLAGVGNLILTPSGHIKLVDINNISTVSLDGPVPLDDRGYPVCDKSIRVIWLLEEKLVNSSPQKDDPIYRTFLDPKRLKDVSALEEAFHLSLMEGEA